MANKSEHLNILMTATTKGRLAKLAMESGRSQSSIAVQAIEARLSMQLDLTPKCATGRPCFMASMHVHATNTLAADIPVMDRQHLGQSVDPGDQIGDPKLAQATA